jgi:pimeloyl-ACP methyl ester carboxylesterase
MFFMPFQILGIWLRGLFGIVLLGLGIYLLTEWYNRRETVVTVSVARTESAGAPEIRDVAEPLENRQETQIVHWQIGWNPETAFLLGGLALIGWSFAGGSLLYPRLFRRVGPEEPKAERVGKGQFHVLSDGTRLWIDSYGPADGDPIVMIHGWGLDSGDWFYAKRELTGRNRLIVWDLPGLGQSERPPDRDWSLERLAHMLNEIVTLAGGKRVTLAGHSIGGMIILTYCKLFPESLGTRIRSLVLAHTTYTNPVRTAKHSALYTALQKPVLEPLCHLMVWLSPVFRAMNWLSYFNGSAHRSTERGSFSGDETRGQLDFMSRYYCQSSPAVIGSGMLAMFRYDASELLPRIGIPTLVIAGEKDETCTPAASQHMATTIPHGQLVVLKAAKHCGIFEFHDRFAAAVREFLAGGSRTASPQALTPAPVLVSGS